MNKIDMNRELLPNILGTLLLVAIFFFLWREISRLKTTVANVVREHNDTVSVLNGHKAKINEILEWFVGGDTDDTVDDTITGVIDVTDDEATDATDATETKKTD